MRKQAEGLFQSISMALLSVFAWGCANTAGGTTEQVPEEISTEVEAVRQETLRSGGRATPVIFDSDMDFDDTAALAYLARQHKMGRIELRAVTVNNNGAGFPGSAIRHARCVLAEMGLSHIPVADGAPTGTNSFSPILRFAVEQILNDTQASCTASSAPSPVPAERVLANAIENSDRPVTVLTTGTLTNLSNAIDVLESRRHFLPLVNIQRVVIMGGAVRVAGNAEVGPTADGSQEINLWADPASASHVVARLSPARVTLVPLDATNHVPVTLDYIARLQADQTTPEAQYVSRMMNHPFVIGGLASGAQVYWWDPLAAIAATGVVFDDVLSYQWTRLRVVTTGVQQGRTQEINSGLDFVRVAFSADRPAFEDEFLDGLNGRR